MVKLTIAIPTYNRIHQLKDTVELLLPQLCPDVQINIFDNCSDTPVEYALSELAQSGIKIHRNKVNIGLSGNFIKCFEECESEWIWILSDDDTPKHNSVKVILEYISAHKDLSFINFNSNLCNHSGYTLLDTFNIGQTELISNLMSFSNLLFVSSSVYNISKLKTSLKSAYYFSYTYAPQTALLLDYLRNNPAATTMYSCASIVEWKAPAEGHKWSDDIIDKAVQDLVYTVDDGDARKLLFEKITNI